MAEKFLKNHFGKTYKYLLEELEEKKALVFIQWDPPNISLDIAGRLSRMLEDAGVSAFAVGGSVGAQGVLLDETVRIIKEETSLPVILFPGNIATITKRADAIYFMSMLNSLDPYYISGAQIASSYPLKEINVEPIPTSYIVLEPGRAVGWVGRAKLIPRDQPYLAGITALAGQYLGSHLIILESGGGAPSPAPPELVSYTRKLIDVPLIVAGGIRTKEFAFDTIKAGADIIHVGTAIENAKKDFSAAKEKISGIIKAVRKAGKQRN